MNRAKYYGEHFTFASAAASSVNFLIYAERVCGPKIVEAPSYR